VSLSNKKISNSNDTLKTFEGEDTSEYVPMNAAIDYILSVQNEDGGWSQSSDGNSSVSLTATVVMLLKQFTLTPRLATSIDKAADYLITKQTDHGAYGSGRLSLLETVLAYNALIGNTKNNAALEKTRNYILSMQRPDGSWNDDPQLTVLAIRALYCADSGETSDTMNQDSCRRNFDTDYRDDKRVQISEPVSPPDDQRGTMSEIEEDLGKTSVAQEDRENKAATKSEIRKKDFKGKVSLAIRRKGGYVADESETGVVDRSLSAVRRAETVVSSVKITGNIAGRVVDGVTKAMISGATVSVADNPPITTDDQGAFIVNVVPGAYRINVLKEGYRDQTYQGNVTAGVTTDVFIYLMPQCTNEDAAVENGKISNQEPLDAMTCESAFPDVTCNSGSPDILQIERKYASRIKPEVQIELNESLFPSTVTPDGDKQVKVTIRLEGVQAATDPIALSAVTSTSGEKISIFFNKTMATPLGKHGQFSVSANGSSVPITAATLNEHDGTRIDLALGTHVTNDQTILMSYSAGDILSSDGKELMSFANMEVTNRVLQPIFSQDGFGYSGQVVQNPLRDKIVMTGYNQWPSGFYKNVLAFMSGVFDGQYIWMIPANADSVIKIDKDTGAMKEYNAWPAGFKKGGHAFAGGVFDGQKIWLVPYYADRVITIDKDTGDMEWFHKRPSEFSNVEYAFTGGVFDGESVWLIPLNADGVVRINKKNTSQETKYNQWPSGFSKGVNAFTGGVFDGENIWMIPSSADKVIKLSSFLSVSVSANITANDTFYFYISQDESTEGVLIGKGNDWSSVYSLNAALVPGVTNYLHIKSTDMVGPMAGLIGDFILNDHKFCFKNGTQRLLTGEDCWTVYTDTFGGTQDEITTICKNGMGKWQTRFGIDLNAQWIWTGNGKDLSTRYFSTPIYYSTFSADPVSNVRLIDTIPDNNIEIYKDSFTKRPYSLLSEKGKTIIEWRFEKIAAGQVENISFDILVKDPVRGEDRSISDGLELLYEDVEKRHVQTELGQCFVHILDSDMVGCSDQPQKESGESQADTQHPDVEVNNIVLKRENHHQDEVIKNVPKNKSIVEESEDNVVLSDYVIKTEIDNHHEEILCNYIGNITAQPNPVYQGLAVTISYSVSSNAIRDLGDLTVDILIMNSDSKEIKKTFESPAQARKGAIITGSFILSTSFFEPHTYTALLRVSQKKQEPPEIIAETNFEVRAINVIVT